MTAAFCEFDGQNIFSASLRPSAATRHRKGWIGQGAGQIRSKHVVQRSTDKGDHANAGSGNSELQRRRDGSTDQNIRVVTEQLNGTSRQLGFDELLLLAASLAVVFHVDQYKMTGDIEDGCNTPLPLWNCDPHHRNFKHLTNQTRYGV